MEHLPADFAKAVVRVIEPGEEAAVAEVIEAATLLDDEELRILAEITDWMKVNDQAIHATRPWRFSGASPGGKKPATGETNFNEKDRRELTSDDVRFTTKGDALFAFVMGVPEKFATIAGLGKSGKLGAGKILQVELLGSPGKIDWRQDEDDLRVQLPESKPSKHALAFKIFGAIQP